MFLKNRLKKKWKEKYFVLYSNRTLCYWTNQYDFQYEKPAKDTIDLSLTQNIEIMENAAGDKGKERRHKHAHIHSQSHDRSSPSHSASWTSLSRKGSMDFGRIFGRSREHEDNTMERSDTKEQKRDEMRFKFRIVQLKKTFTFSIEGDNKEFKHWIANLEHVIFGSVVHKGYLFELVAKTKKDKKKKWVKRWFIIYNRKELRYFSDPTRKTSYGMIALSNLQTMSKSEDHKAKKKYGQLLYLIKLQFKSNKTKTKISIVASLSMKERDLWYDTICDVCTNQATIKKKHHVKPPKKKQKYKQKRKQKLKVPSTNANTSHRSRKEPKEVILPIPTSTRSMSKQSVFSVLSTSTSKTGAASPSFSRSGYASDGAHLLYNCKDDLHLNNLMGVRKDIERLQNEILCLKIQNAMIKNKTNVMECREEYVEDALLDCDQYLILDRDWRNWSYLEIVEWITNLEYGRYNKYKTVLFANMKYREMEGMYLKRIDKLDLSNFFGITNYADCCDLYKQIRKLTKIYFIFFCRLLLYF
eukprot:187111_1